MDQNVEITPEQMLTCTIDALRWVNGYVSAYQFEGTVKSVAVARGLLKDPGVEEHKFGPNLYPRFRDALWECLRLGLLAPGHSDGEFHSDSFSRTELGNRVVFGNDPSPYDRGSYLGAMEQVRQFDDVERRFIPQAMTAFRFQMYDAAVVMLGCASEHLIVELTQAIAVADPSKDNKVHQILMKNASEQIKFLEGVLPSCGLRAELKRGIPDRFRNLATVLREVRNEGGHPIGEPVDRETCEIAFSLFRHYRPWAWATVEALNQ